LRPTVATEEQEVKTWHILQQTNFREIDAVGYPLTMKR